MSDFDLESKIKSIRAPERGVEYWEEFPDRVLAELRARPGSRASARPSTLSFAWMMRTVFACLMLVFCLWQSGAPRALSHVLSRDELKLRREVRHFHSNLGRFMQDEHGLDRLIEDKS